MSRPRILVVDDDPHLRAMLRVALEQAGFDVDEAADGRQGLVSILDEPPDLVVLDVLMPELDGIEVCRRVRQRSDVPIIFLSSKGDEIDRVLGLELGGDDYLSKPFSPRELVSRVRAVLRRVQAPGRSDVRVLGALQVDLDAHRCTIGGQQVELTLTEFRLLEALISPPGKACSRKELMSRAYEGRHFVSGRTVDSHIRRVRQKLAAVDPDTVYIETVHSLGYRFHG